jgi:chorismate dehydratase
MNIFVRIGKINMARLKISAISYLNTAPLMWDFEHGSAGADFDISYTVPSRCAEQLREGSADIGIIPAAAYATVPNLLILPDVAIASRQAVRSILLVSTLPLEQIKTVALDTSSLTSVALTKVLFAKWWGEGRTFTPMVPELARMLQTHDAALLIGDPALKVDRSKYRTYDLAEEWIRLTGKPFVFAFWAVRRESLEKTESKLDLPLIFRQSRDHGLELQNVAQTAVEWSKKLGLTEEDVRNYLTRNIYYNLDADCMDGLRLFLDYAQQCGALPAVPSLDLLQPVEGHPRI